MIVRNLAGDVVSNVRLGDSVRESGTEPTRDSSKDPGPAEQVAIKSRERSTRKRKRRSAIVGQQRISMLHM
jgi:hypothetical protein